jgi:3D (Asp-Asp-Asp) domain-containing protein
MNFLSIAVSAIFAFSGASSLDKLPLAPVADQVATTTTLAIADESTFTPASDVEPLTVTLTSYNAVPSQTDAEPNITASGAPSNAEVVAARSVDLAADLPFGTVIALSYDGADSENCRFGAVSGLIGYRVIADSMHPRKRDQIDVLLDENDTVPVHGKETNPALALGFCKNVTAHVIGKIAIKDMPATQEELAKMVSGDTFAVAK